MYHRCEVGAVVDRQRVDLARCLRLGVDFGVGAADEPEHRRHAPFDAEEAEVLARRDGADAPYPLSRKVRAKSVGDALRRARVVGAERIAVERRDFGRLRPRP